ncbi:hypothetical protein V492_03359, partial [Pseudogymnoascus sp. VKM F-4246]
TVERETEREREYYRSPSPPPVRARRPARAARPTMLRRQSSLDTFDRKPALPRYMQQPREEAGPIARRERERDPRDFEDERTVYPERYVQLGVLADEHAEDGEEQGAEEGEDEDAGEDG